ncbi:MAG: Gfo/Idh/MocA family oxidoreductase [Candidatus Bathyarchaeota archaeon]|nr:Gfo/Idh/MocA family oxidoreductase [Candidatus Bathyarchaeum sp.]
MMNVGVVGCGFISGIHVNAWRDAGVNVVAACDLNEKLAKEFTKNWNIPSYYTSLPEMLKNEKLSAISVCVPPKFHADVAIEALKSNCHIVVEKPFTITTDDAERLLGALQKSSRKMTIIHSQLFEHSIFSAMNKVKAGEIGQVIGMDVSVLHSPDEIMAGDKNHWCHKLPGGRFGENLPHPVYLLQEFLGNLEIKSILTDKIGPNPWMPIDELRVTLEAEKNKFGTINISFNAAGHDRTVVHTDIYGTNGTIHADIYPVSSLLVSKPGRGVLHFDNVKHQAKIWGAYIKNIILKRTGPRNYSISHVRIIKAFVDSLSGKGEPLVTPEMGYENVKVVEEICKQIDAITQKENPKK